MEQEINQTVIRRGFGLKEEVKPLLNESYHSSLIERIKESDYELQAGDLTVRLAKEFGFCYGVDRAVELAYETRKRFPDRKIYLTSEIIHNPRVNSKLKELGIQFLDHSASSVPGAFSIEAVKADDVVLIPAFGTPTTDLELLKSKKCVLVDTTCGSVMAVWRRVEQYSREGFTSVIHGKFNHEETRATSSRAMQFPKGRFLVVRDQEQAQKVCDFILGKMTKQAFLNEFQETASPGFDPDRDLNHVGCANQTTMLSSESLKIADMVKSAIRERFGKHELADRFSHFDTICSATQDRQDAVLELAEKGVDVMVVVGGYNSSNTSHLVEISGKFCTAYHVRDANEIKSRSEIHHKPADQVETVITNDWLPYDKLRIGVTAGASTPNRVTEEVILKILECARYDLP
jgi:4-hydroxy-3-methylbut-2-en-1-yl diphosphate reductase